MPKPKKAILDVLYQSDNNYAVVTGVSIVSLLENNKDIDQININLIDGGITQKNLDNIKLVVKKYGRSINIISGKNIEAKLVEHNCRPYKGSYVTYYKLLAFGHISAPSGKVLMLDGDILVMQNLSEICDMDLKGFIMSEIIDPYMPSFLKQAIGIPSGQPYFNAGVMLINQSEWNRQKCENKILDHWEYKKSDYLFADQDVTNVLFAGKIKELHLKYNFYSKNYMLYPHERRVMKFSKKMLEDVRRDGAFCVHCIDESWRTRPWYKGSSHTMISEWDDYLSISPWKDWEKLTPKLNLYHKIDRILHHILPKVLYAIVLKIVSALFARLSISKRMLDSKKMNVVD